MPCKDTVHHMAGITLEMICDSKLDNDLIIQHLNYNKVGQLGESRVSCGKHQLSWILYQKKKKNRINDLDDPLARR